MSTVVKADAAEGVVTIAVDGVPDIAEIRDVIIKTWSDPVFQSTARGLWDLRNADLSGISAAELRTVADLEENRRPDLPRSRIALVVSREVDFGMLRMLEAFLPESTLDYHVFRDFDDAWHWLRAE